MLLSVFIVLAALTTHVQKHALMSASSLAAENSGFNFPSLQSYSQNPQYNALEKEATVITLEDDNDNENGNDIGNEHENNAGSSTTSPMPDTAEHESAQSEQEDSKTLQNLAALATKGINDRRNEVVASAPRITSRAQRRQAWYDHLDTQNQPYPQLDYAPQRIPGYLQNSGRTLFGFVMRDLTTRVMSRTIAQSNILVVSEDAPYVARLLRSEKETGRSEEELRQQINHTVGGSTLIHANAQQHAYFGLYDGLDAESEYYGQGNVDDWWKQMGQSSTEPRTSWFLMMLIDSLKSDEILHNSQMLIREATVTYIVASFGSDTSFGSFGMEQFKSCWTTATRSSYYRYHMPSTTSFGPTMKLPKKDYPSSRVR